MTDLAQALLEIQDIRRQVASTTVFRGYGPATLSVASCLALAAGLAQAHWLLVPVAHPQAYVVLWLCTAVLCAALIASQMLARAHRLHSSLANEMIHNAVVQFIPSGVAGAVLPFLLLHTSPSSIWVLPGVWQLLSGLGIFACRSFMPRTMPLVGGWFFLSGFTCIALGPGQALSPAAMSVPYAIGMTVIAAIQYRSATKEACA